jgi:hypothetical protein
MTNVAGVNGSFASIASFDTSPTLSDKVVRGRGDKPEQLSQAQRMKGH